MDEVNIFVHVDNTRKHFKTVRIVERSLRWNCWNSKVGQLKNESFIKREKIVEKLDGSKETNIGLEGKIAKT